MIDNDVKLIGICGAARAGKDSVAKAMTQILVDTRNEKLQDHVIATESFAAPIKSMVAMLLDFFGYGSIMNPNTLAPYLEGDEKETELENIGASARKLMQTLGTDWGRKVINDDIWLNSMEERITHYGEAKKHGHEGAFVIITDVRFDNEAEMIKRKGGVIVQVTTTRETDAAPEHDSERGVSACMVDSIIPNDKDIEDLNFLVLKYLEGLLDEKLEDSAPKLIRIPGFDEGDGDETD